MKHRKTIIFTIAVVLLLAYLLHKNKQIMPITKSGLPVYVATNQVPVNPPIVNITTNAARQEPSYSAPVAEKVAWWREMTKEDPYFEFKMPISFYGKVVDDEGQLVSGASVEFSWMDLSSEGTSQRNTTSDGLGLFSLTSAAGKSLTVSVSKQGYKPYHSQNRHTFENGILSSPDRHYTPDQMNPVVFVLRKNREAETLEVRENLEAKLQPGESKFFIVGPNGASILVERLPEESTNARTWNAQVSIPNGGLELTTEEFPYEAPLDGYESSLNITNGTAKPPNWPWGWGAMFYVKTSQGYGRVKVHYTPNMSYIYVDSWFNPNSSSRNLEVDPSKVEIVNP